MNCGSQVSIRQDPSGNIIITVDGTSYDIGPRTDIPEVACAVDGSGIFINDVLCEFPSSAEGLVSVELDGTTLNFERVSADPLSVDLLPIQGDKLPEPGINGVMVNTDDGLEVRAPTLFEVTGSSASPGVGRYIVSYDGFTGLNNAPLRLTDQPMIWSVPMRDGSGCFKVGAPLAADDAANKAYVDGKIPEGVANQTIVWDTTANGGLGGYVSGLLRRGSVTTATVGPNGAFVVGFAASAAPSDALRPMPATRDATPNTVVARDINGRFRAVAASSNTDVVILQQLNERMSANARLAVNETLPLSPSATLGDVIAAYNALLTNLKLT